MIQIDDPRLTAYALGEMAADERQAFEAELAESEEAQREVAEITRAAQLLSDELHRSSPAPLSEAVRREILEGAAAERNGSEPPNKVVPITAKAKPSVAKRRGLALAAPIALAIAAGLTGLYVVSGENAPRSDMGWAGSEREAKMSGDEGAPMVMPMSSASPRAAATASPVTAAARDAQEFGMIGLLPHDQAAKGEAKTKAHLGERGRVASLAPAAGRPVAPGPRRPGGDKLEKEAPSVDEPLMAPTDNPFIDTRADTRSTFSTDVDTASYSMIRRSIEEGALPHPAFVRIEEMVNYFGYSYPEPNDEAFGVSVDATAAPWAAGHRLVRIGLKGRTIQMKQRPASNLVFLVDVSGSMNGPDRLPMLKQALTMLVDQLDERDRVSIVVYAGASGMALEPTPGNQREKIRAALDRLSAGGSTNGGQGIELAYATAAKSFVQGGTNRVILATDGDFNVGVTSRDALVRLVEDKAKTGTFLTVLGFGRGNFRDGTMESLADKGNGNYAYIDKLDEAKKVLVEQASATLLTIAKDVKIQVTFDPARVQSFRLIGYENRVLAHEDFENDRKDAGDIGAGHRVTALYEIVPTGAVTPGTHLGEVALRYKQPDGVTSRVVEATMVDAGGAFEDASTDFRFAASVAAFGMVLRGSPHRGGIGFGEIAQMARGATGDDPDGYRRGFVGLVEKASALGDR